MFVIFAGLKYERENENDLKDKLDFPDEVPANYPPGSEYLEKITARFVFSFHIIVCNNDICI